MKRQETDTIVLRNHKGEEKTMTRGEYHNAARHASDHYSHDPSKSHRPESTTPQDRQFHIQKIVDRSGRTVQDFNGQDV
jgi:hypothetical protein